MCTWRANQAPVVRHAGNSGPQASLDLWLDRLMDKGPLSGRGAAHPRHGLHVLTMSTDENAPGAGFVHPPHRKSRFGRDLAPDARLRHAAFPRSPIWSAAANQAEPG